MPCYDERNSPSYINEHELKPLRLEVSRLSAVLCGILSKYEHPRYNGAGISIVLQDVDWKEVGVSEEWVREWFKNHKIEDQQRLLREIARKRQQQEQQDLKKLELLAKKLGKKVV